MDRQRKRRLEGAGWKVGSATEFLDLTHEEAAFIELKLRLSEALRARRTREAMSQEELARRIGSSQSRVAKMEASDRTVSIDLLVRGLLATGATREDIGAAITERRTGRPARRRGTRTTSK